ncbi:excinuclease ABC subunit UvrA [Brevibacterium sp. 5221]|uniref:UvrABC system protein A n=1 Tax=Brevibacterium rongguiense TaxID=2695267 RepID=A0A6N9H632_9MICO|nr:excinuclease ABC subunit UvrA [Brevibacterium rongguiense]MYM19321.1 excinuclease ABC subunit UvrA [Brevibacterium rongguiense]
MADAANPEPDERGKPARTSAAQRAERAFTGIIEVRGARVHNLRDIDVDVPLGKLVGIAGVSGSGKSSLAMGVLYAEGSRRYIEALSTYTRRRMGQAARADVNRVSHVPAALALRQRPGVPGVRSTFGTSTELLNVLRLMFSRLAGHLCPHGHRQEPTLRVAEEVPFSCPICGAQVHPPGAEELAFNSEGACPECEGTGVVRTVDDASLIRDPHLSLDEGAVIPWQMFGFRVQPQIAREFGVRTDVPWDELSDAERQIVLDGPEEKKHITVTTKNGVHDLNFTFRNARLTVLEELKRAGDEKRLRRVSRFLTVSPCPACGGSRLSERARGPEIGDENLAAVTAKTLDQLLAWTDTVPATLPEDMLPMARSLSDALRGMARRLVELGLGYLGLDRASATLSTGERQRVQLARAVRNETTGVLYVLDEPSIGLHPSNVTGLLGVVEDLLADGNSVVLVDHEPLVLRQADHLIEIGPGSGAAGGRVVATGTVAQLGADPASLIGGFLTGSERVSARTPAPAAKTFDHGTIRLNTAPIHTVHELEAAFPVGRMTAVTGVSGSGKTTLVLDSLIPALRARTEASTGGATSGGSGGGGGGSTGGSAAGGDSGPTVPAHVRAVEPGGITRVNVVDAAPIGINVRSTVATYTGIMDELRRAYARLPAAQQAGLDAGSFSYNTGALRCPRCEGTGQVTLDVQFLPDVDIACPECEGGRYAPQALDYRRPSADGGPALALPELLALTAAELLDRVGDLAPVRTRLEGLRDVGLGYLTLTEATPELSGGEAQRLKLVSELQRGQRGTLFVFDEPTVGLHPLDVRTLIGVLQRLLDQGGTVLVIEHDLDMIANADHIVDMGPGGGTEGGRIIATGTPRQVAADPDSVTGRYLAQQLADDEGASGSDRA